MPLSDAKLRNLRPTGKRFELSDRDGLVLRVSQKGVLSWSLSFRVWTSGRAGKKQRRVLGTYPVMGLSEARQAATTLKQAARSGHSPATDVSHGTETVGDLIDRYERDHLRLNVSSGPGIAKLLRRHLEPSWGTRSLTEIRRPDLAALLEEVRVPRELLLIDAAGRKSTQIRGGRGAAIEVRKWVRAMFEFAVETGDVETNPFAGMRTQIRAASRDRVLSMQEIALVWGAAEELGNPWTQLYRLLILTGARRSEWSASHWSWLVEPSCLIVPAQAAKTRRAQVVPLSAMSQSIVRSLSEGKAGDYVFSTTGGDRCISGFSKIKHRLDDAILRLSGAVIAPWVTHDLRRSMATHMERLAIQPHVIEACLGHTLKGVQGTYRRYGYLPEKTDALRLWSEEVTSSITRYSDS